MACPIRRLSLILAASVLVSAGPLSAQVTLPELPDNWWTGLEDNGYPSATFEMNVGMPITLTQSIQSIEGSRITVSTGTTMMGNAMPATSQVMDVAGVSAEDAIEMIQQGLLAGGGAGGPPGANVAVPEVSMRKIEDAQCTVGTLTLDCDLYEVTVEGVVSRVWHAPSIPPVFMGGVVRAEATFAGQDIVTAMTFYRGKLIE